MKYNIESIKSFVRFIELNSPVETTNKYLRETFFNNNKQASASVFKILKESGILMTNNSWGKGKGQKWYYLNNDVDIESLFTKEPVVKEPVVKEPVVKEPVVNVPVEFDYKGIYKVSEVISLDDKLLAKKIRIDLGNRFCERLFNIETSGIGWSKEKTWFLFDKVMKHMPYEGQFD